MTNTPINRISAQNILTFVLIAGATFSSFGLSLINWAPYWDDWTIAGQIPHQVIQSFADCGRPQLGYLHAFIIQLPFYQLWYKLSTFFLHLASAVLFIPFSKRVFQLSSRDAVLAALVFATIPLYQAREGFVMLQYSISIFFLVFSTLFYLKHRTKNVFYFALSFLLFIPALFIEASGPIIMFIALYELTKLIRSKPYNKYLLTYHSLVFIFPVLYIIFIRNILAPADICAGNNQILWPNLLTLPIGFIKALVAVVIGPISIYSRLVYQESPFFVLLIPLFMVLLAPLLWKQIEPSKNLDIKKIGFQTLTALILAFAAVAPFHMVGKPVDNWDWDSRFQAFLLISTPIFVVVAFKALLRPWVYRIAMTFVIATFIATNFGYRLMFLRDNIKLELLSEGLSQLEEVQNNNSFMFNDLTVAYNAMNREFRLYDYSGLFHLAFKDEKRVGYAYFNPSERTLVRNALEGNYPGIYLLKNLPKDKINTIDKCIKIEHQKTWLSLIDTLKIAYFKQPADVSQFFKITINDPIFSEEANEELLIHCFGK